MAAAMITIILLCFTGLSFVFSTGLSRPRIVNGVKLDDISDYLYVVTLLIEDNHFNQFLCGGTLIDPRHVITSAHCLENGTVIETIVGSNNLIYGGSHYGTFRARMHPGFNRNNRTGMAVNDIGLITLAGSVKEVTKFPKRRRRAFQDFKTPCKILGKGDVGFPEKDVHADKLKLGFVKQVPKSVCERQWRKKTIHRKLAPHLLCMTSNDDAACIGDSGGPLLCNGQLTGVMFFVRPCGTGVPDLYVDITHYNGWIDGIINNEKYKFTHLG